MVAGQVVVPQLALQTITPIPVASGVVTINQQWTIVAPVDARQQIAVSTSFAALTIPTGATCLLLIPPSSNTNTLTLKGVTGDTGIALAKTTPTFLTIAGSGSIGLLGGGSFTVEAVWL